VRGGVGREAGQMQPLAVAHRGEGVRSHRRRRDVLRLDDEAARRLFGQRDTKDSTNIDYCPCRG